MLTLIILRIQPNGKLMLINKAIQPLSRTLKKIQNFRKQLFGFDFII